MEALLLMMTIQGCLGAFDTIYHHEFTERLPWKASASRELWIHGIRNFFYGIIFLSLGWIAWGGELAWVFAATLIGEICLTLWDFVIEDQSRKLPPSERITHTVLAINYGVILCLLTPVLLGWAEFPAGFHLQSHGLWSWVMTVFAAGVTAWAVFDYLRSSRFRAPADVPPLHLSQPNQRVLVTGGTGLIGSRLVQGLIDDGHDVTVLTRDKSKAAKFRGRLTLIDSLSQLNPVDVIINLAGESLSNGLWTKAKKQKLYASRLDLTRDLIAWIATAREKPRHLINASAIGAYGHSDTLEFREASAPGEPDLASDLCRQWESLAQQATRYGTKVTLIRLGIVLSLDGGALAQMLFPFEFGGGGPMGSGRQWMSWIHIDDVAGLIGHVIDNTLEGPVNAVAPQPLPNLDFTRTLGRAMHRPAIMPLPGFALKLLLGEMAQTILLNGQKVIPARAETTGYRFRHPNLDGALHHLLGGKM
ncbi:hypothetical protein ABAC460_03695 [Asticcacaulis sp. AC460]|uniref:TIGR01777 family oxidoreductase n=1 Tax=Asticcacaulis sp. AC460 TaxID=1282360 RepID=UPI0003C3CCAF|nr:TIGR01777 family oxidoreductase [Asticcacaulis sp. AC460]ESQ92013.1 hypothetical protein ABAC460_03695 [Asticcacaulis sp. AC460]